MRTNRSAATSRASSTACGAAGYPGRRGVTEAALPDASDRPRTDEHGRVPLVVFPQPCCVVGEALDELLPPRVKCRKQVMRRFCGEVLSQPVDREPPAEATHGGLFG